MQRDFQGTVQASIDEVPSVLPQLRRQITIVCDDDEASGVHLSDMILEPYDSWEV